MAGLFRSISEANDRAWVAAALCSEVWLPGLSRKACDTESGHVDEALALASRIAIYDAAGC